MSKGLEALDKLEECAYAMKDLPMSNWIDLAENEAELDLKIMNWTEEIKFELFKGKQALDRLEKLEKENQELIKKADCCMWKDCNKISQENAKLKKALEIIKKKRVNIGCFYHVVFVLKKDYESCKLNNNNIMYNICDTEKEFLTHEEFDLLKEVFDDENNNC